MKQICEKCRKPVSLNDNFCRSCGSKFIRDSVDVEVLKKKFPEYDMGFLGGAPTSHKFDISSNGEMHFEYIEGFKSGFEVWIQPQLDGVYNVREVWTKYDGHAFDRIITDVLDEQKMTLSESEMQEFYDAWSEITDEESMRAISGVYGDEDY